MSEGLLQTFVRTTDPGNPPAGYVYLYCKNGQYFFIDENGDVLPLDGSSGGSKWEDFLEGIRPVDNKEIAVGRPGAGREAVFGEGDSYNDVSQILVYSFDGSSYTDRTSLILSEDANRLQFDGNTANNAIYIASKVNDGSDFLKHPGMKVELTTAASLGGGDIAFEFFNGSTWEEFDHMATNNDTGYRPLANEKFESTGSKQYYYNQSILDTWTKNDPMSLGTTYFWVRYRITSTITTSPEFDKIKIYPLGRSELNEDGFSQFYGSAQFTQDLNVRYGQFEAANNSPANQDLYLADNVAVGYQENLFQDGTTDRSGFNIFLPRNINTAEPINLRFTWIATSNESADDIDFVVRWALQTPSTNVYTSTANAPTNATGQRTFSGSYPQPANSQFEPQTLAIELAIPEGIAEYSTGNGDILWVSFERQGGSDDYSGDVALIQVDGTYTAWKNGGRL